MRRVNIFIALLLASVFGFVASGLWISSIYAPAPSSDFMSSMMNQMMGLGYTGRTGMAPTAPAYMVALPLFFTALVVIGLVGAIYSVYAPELSSMTARPQTRSPEQGQHSPQQLLIVMKTLKPEEQKVLEILQQHGGSCLQKDIVRETGLSRLKTHRILARFIERGLVTAIKHGNTNMITMSDWLLHSSLGG